jgi:hypothetical protein
VTTNTNYPVLVLGDYPTSYWRLAESTGGVAYDSNQNILPLYPRISSASMAGFTQNATSFLAHSKSATSTTGTTSAISFANSSSLQITTDFTMELWINFSSFGSNGAGYSLVAKQSSGSSGSTGEYELYVHSNGTSLTPNFRQNNGFVTLNATTNLTSTGTWYHLVVTRNPALNATTIYINGVAAGSTTYTAATTTTASVFIGASGTFSTVAASITEVALYHKTLSAAQVLNHYNWGIASDALATAYGGGATLYNAFPYPALGPATVATYSTGTTAWGTFTWK